jgi:hypothetical protein
VKGFVVLELTDAGLGSFEFRPLPARPMVTRRVFFGDASAVEVYAGLTAAIESTPDDAVVQLRVAAPCRRRSPLRRCGRSLVHAR